MNGTELKPSRTLKIGEKFSVRNGAVTFSYEVLKLSENRLGAKLVPDFMRDITAPEQLEMLELARLAGQNGRDRGTGRPTKKDRREIEQFISDDYYEFDEIDDIDDEE